MVFKNDFTILDDVVLTFKRRPFLQILNVGSLILITKIFKSVYVSYPLDLL